MDGLKTSMGGIMKQLTEMWQHKPYMARQGSKGCNFNWLKQCGHKHEILSTFLKLLYPSYKISYAAGWLSTFS